MDKEKGSTYTPSQKKAIYAYRERHRDTYNAYQRAYHAHKMATDEEYRKYKEQKGKEASEKRRERKRLEKLEKATP
jgi:hypothetical protein